MNLYGMVGNDAVGRWDYLGLEPEGLNDDASRYDRLTEMFKENAVDGFWNDLEAYIQSLVPENSYVKLGECSPSEGGSEKEIGKRSFKREIKSKNWARGLGIVYRPPFGKVHKLIELRVSNAKITAEIEAATKAVCCCTKHNGVISWDWWLKSVEITKASVELSYDYKLIAPKWSWINPAQGRHSTRLWSDSVTKTLVDVGLEGRMRCN